MSEPGKPPERAAHPANPKRVRISSEDQEELEKLDDVFARIKKVVPEAPYILSISSLEGYRYKSTYEASAWMMGHLFQHSEEDLQYQTLLFREPYKDCLVLSKGQTEPEPEPEQPKTQPSNPSLLGPKKKISLSAYRSKQANGVITPGSKKVSPALPPTKPNLPPTEPNGVKSAEKPMPPVPAVGKKLEQEKRPFKRPAPEPLHLREKPEKRLREGTPETRPPPPEKLEHADKRDNGDFNINIDTSGPSSSTPHGLPPLLSPVDQPLNNPYGLPAILSPTLPSNVQAELDRMATKRQRAESNASTSSEPKVQLLAAPDPPNEPATGAPPQVTEGPAPSLVVKLRFSKARRADVSRILKLRPGGPEKKDTAKGSPAKGHVKSADVPKAKEPLKATPRRPESAAISNKLASSTVKVSDKRLRTEGTHSAPAIAGKRPKASSSQEGHTTPPGQTALSPPLSSKSSGQKAQVAHATPRKDHKAMAMARATSSDGIDSTPGRYGTTPAGGNQDSKILPPSGPLTGKKQAAEFALLSQTSLKFNQLGRNLKYDAQKMLAEKHGKATKEDERRTAVAYMECILSYMAAYYAHDASQNMRGRPVDVDNTWKTLWPLCNISSRNTKDFLPLDGLRSYLSAVICATICTHMAPRVPRPSTHGSAQDIPHTELVKQHNVLTENFTMLSEYYMRSLRAFQEARVALPFDEMPKAYPKTWAGRETNAKLALEKENISATKLSGPYFLPIQNDTTPLQAARFGLKFLEEYCEKERLPYNIRVNLDRPE
ncbi:hypothetical protein BS50DRAFT_215443 [Corynespora cassiicola Philippines]|uniref:Uncharacterized protein n=1 Tax=Corynespora cassiicola Philippines TaxID=1448308 RepID=A0A2T2N4D8_CORCC|nr:hypothetical protein BS50DRAFT_215443 [Corynespora cassiicola Philippines]